VAAELWGKVAKGKGRTALTACPDKERYKPGICRLKTWTKKHELNAGSKEQKNRKNVRVVHQGV